jgi:hypothetical protein
MIEGKSIMSTTRVPHSPALRRSVALALVLALLLSALPLTAFAQESGTAIGPHIVTLQPGASTEIAVHGYCLNYGLPFPGNVLLPTELASGPLRNAAIYSLANGYVDDNALDVERAIWNLFDGTRLDGMDYTLADKIIEYANSGVQPADVVDGVPHMVELMTAGSLEASVSGFVNIAPEQGSFFGTGTLTITNVSQVPQRFVVSYGTVTVDEIDGDQQNMLVFPSEPAPATPTPPATGGALPAEAMALVALAGLGLSALGIGSMRRRSIKAA